MPVELSQRTPEIVEPWLAGKNPMGRSGFPSDIANAVVWLASNESSFVTGHALVVDGGFTAGVRWTQQLEEFDQLGALSLCARSDYGPALMSVAKTATERGHI